MSETMEDKVAKLMRLANDGGATEAEALAAMEAAQRLCNKHNLEMASISLEEEHEATRLDIGNEAVRMDKSGQWRVYLMSHIAMCMGGKVIRSKDGYGKHSSTLTIFAPEGAIDTIKRTYNMLEKWMETESEFFTNVREETWIHGRTYRNSWILGALSRIQDRLSEVHRDTMREAKIAGQENALVKIGADVDDAVADMFPNVRTAQQSRSNVDAGAYRAGHAAGADANIGQNSMPGVRRQIGG